MLCTTVKSLVLINSTPFTYTVLVIIVGAGVAGCATALSVLKSNPRARLLVIDDSDDTSFKVYSMTTLPYAFTN